MDCPTTVKAVEVSTTAKPVTQTALVEVNNALVNVIPFVVALGSINKNPPVKAKIIKLPTKTIAGLK